MIKRLILITQNSKFHMTDYQVVFIKPPNIKYEFAIILYIFTRIYY